MENFLLNIDKVDYIENLPQEIHGPIILLMALIIGLVGIIIASAVILGVYIYSSLALSTLAKKMGYKKSWLAWIPIANLFLFPLLAGKKWMWGFLLFIPIVNAIFLTICLWTILEKRGYDGKWGLIGLGYLFSKAAFAAIPFIVILILLGVLAWKKEK